MPQSRYIAITINNTRLDLSSIEDLPVSISYALEDRENFQQKKSSTAYNVVIPATVSNSALANTFNNPSIEDMTTGQAFRSNQPAVIECNGIELLVGKAFLVAARHASTPLEYEYNFYGGNGDWLIDLKETTLHDVLRDLSFIFTKQLIIDSWDFDGSDAFKDLPFVFAPVRYGDPLATFQLTDPVTGRVTGFYEDYNMEPSYMKPALSKYWLLFRGFKTLGYDIISDFFDTEYFRRQVLPWTWGSFLTSPDTQLENLDFLAKSAVGVANMPDGGGDYFGFTGIYDAKVTNDSFNGAFDNYGVYDYDSATFTMRWTYLPQFNYGTLEGVFHLSVFIDAVATWNSDVELRAQWFLNGVRVMHGADNGNGTELVNINGPTAGKRTWSGIMDDFATFTVNPGDTVTVQLYLHVFNSGRGYGGIHFSVDAFELDYFRIPLGGTINFENYTGFKKWKFLDFLAGVVDEFNLCLQTDPINKAIYIEPMHPYSLTNDFSTKAGGYYNGTTLDWTAKQDLSKTSELQLFSDHERELVFRYKDDAQDGSLKVVQDRNLNLLALCKYVLPDRFKAGRKEIENRFFAPTMHMDFVVWRGLSTDPNFVPQLVILQPENISQTSRDAAQNTFEPKSCYYWGIKTDQGWIFDGERILGLPLMFAAYYRQGGEQYPILSYADEVMNQNLNIGDIPVIGKGLMRRFFHQRLEIMRNGQYYRTYFHLDNNDIANFLHREHIVLRGERWELTEILNYRPLREETTECLLKKWSPIHAE